MLVATLSKPSPKKLSFKNSSKVATVKLFAEVRFWKAAKICEVGNLAGLSTKVLASAYKPESCTA